MWKGLSQSPEYLSYRRRMASSYFWDRLIERLVDDYLTDGVFDMHSKQVTDNQLAIMTMALQPREYRAGLADAFKEFLLKGEQKVASRVARGYAEVGFVFLLGSSADRETRARELALRGLVVRGRLPGVKTVVGIAVDPPGHGGHSFDIVYIHIPEWTPRLENQVAGIQASLHYFEGARWGKP